MRQYAILYRRTGMTDFKRLEPAVDANLYDRPGVTAAVDHMREHPEVAAMAVKQNGNELYNITSFENEAAAPRAFAF